MCYIRKKAKPNNLAMVLQTEYPGNLKLLVLVCWAKIKVSVILMTNDYCFVLDI